MKKAAQGFTLVELLIVIAIIAILAAVVAVIVNPVEITRRGRDATRLSDLGNLSQAINVALQSGKSVCVSGDPNPCTGNSFAGTRVNTGLGWVRTDLSGSDVSVPVLPIDPLNTSAATAYSYAGSNPATNNPNTYELDAVLESATYAPKMTNDGGADNAHYEVGTSLTLILP